MTVSLKPDSHGSAGAGSPASAIGWTTSPFSVRHEAFAVHYLQDHLVDVHRVGVAGGVVELPDLGRADGRILADRLHPELRFGDIVDDVAEERLGGPFELVALGVVAHAHLLDQSQRPRHRLRR
jgi:hypothetical protein